MQLQIWDSVQLFEDPDGHVVKFVFTKPDAVVETVLYKYPTYRERTVICHSVMSGCPIGCRFCGTGDFFIRSLTTEEMLEQVEYALDYACEKSKDSLLSALDIRKLQIMSMSMGEPMLNKSLAEVYTTLHARYQQASLLMSTSAPNVNYDWFMELSERIPTVGMQFSVHASTDVGRDALIPFAEKLNLMEIEDKGNEFYFRTGRKPFFNYCAGETNSSQEDANRLAELFTASMWEATVSVICERDSSGMATSNDRQKQLATDFSQKLVELGFGVRVFDPAGQDTIGGGCGQLWFVQDWAAKNPAHVIKSVGFGKGKVHAPTNTSSNPSTTIPG